MEKALTKLLKKWVLKAQVTKSLKGQAFRLTKVLASRPILLFLNKIH